MPVPALSCVTTSAGCRGGTAIAAVSLEVGRSSDTVTLNVSMVVSVTVEATKDDAVSAPDGATSGPQGPVPRVCGGVAAWVV